MPAFGLAAKINGVLILLLGIATILGVLLQCQPFAYNRDHTIPGSHCGDQVLSYKITGGLNVTLDVITLLLPIPYFALLEMAIFLKLSLIATFAVGFAYVHPAWSIPQPSEPSADRSVHQDMCHQRPAHPTDRVDGLLRPDVPRGRSKRILDRRTHAGHHPRMRATPAAALWREVLT